MARVVFFCHAARRLLESVEFYKQDIDVLKAQGHDVIIATRVWQIPISYDVMYVWWWTHAAIPVIISKLLRRGSIITGVFNLEQHYGCSSYFTRPWWQRLLIRYAVKHADINIFLSRYEEELCEEYFRLENTSYCPLVLQEDYLRGPGEERELSILNIGWSSRANLERKGVPLLLRALALLKERGRSVHTYLAGHQGDGLSWLKQLVKEYGIEKIVTVLGEISREEKIRRLRACELYVQPSYFEGFGLAQAEAMGCGACVITCPVGAVEEVVGSAGLYVEPGDAAGLADAIDQMVTNTVLRRQYQQKAVERMRDEFSAGRKQEIFEKIFIDIGSKEKSG